MKKRLISWLLTLTMIVTMLPASIIPAFAAGDGVNISGAQELILNASGATEITQDGTYTVTGNVNAAYSDRCRRSN